METIKKQYSDKMDKAFIEERVPKLLPDRNFYFYQMRDDEVEMQQEWAQMEAFLEDNIRTPRVFIQSGMFEPVHL